MTARTLPGPLGQLSALAPPRRDQVFESFVKELKTLLEQGYTGNVTVRVQHGVIRNYRTEKVQVPGEALDSRGSKG